MIKKKKKKNKNKEIIILIFNFFELSKILNFFDQI